VARVASSCNAFTIATFSSFDLSDIFFHVEFLELGFNVESSMLHSCASEPVTHTCDVD